MKSAILITARLKSSRLPMKVVKSVFGVPMIVHMLDRLKLANIPEEIIICTSLVGKHAKNNPNSSTVVDRQHY